MFMEGGNDNPVNPRLETTLTIDRAPELSFQEISKLVSPEGACENLDLIRVSQGSVWQSIVNGYIGDIKDDQKLVSCD